MDVPAQALPVPRASKQPDKPKQERINARNKTAIDAMVWDGLNRRDAATLAGITDHSLYVALTKPHVRGYYLSQLEVLRTSERARNIHVLAAVRDQETNQMARVAAVKTLEQIEDITTTSQAAQRHPGVVIMIGGADPAKSDPQHVVIEGHATPHDDSN